MAYIRTIDEQAGPIQPVCRHMRSKAMYVAGQMEPPAEAEQLGSGNCWCIHTQHVYGPDNQLVDRRDCHSGRACYEGTL